MSTPSYQAPALSRGLEILEFLASVPGPIPHIEIARSLKRTPGELFRLLQVLEREGYIARDAGNAYHLTLKLLRITSATNPVKLLVDRARSPMRDYARSQGQECHLSLLEDGQQLVIAQESGTAPVGLRVRNGSIHDPRRTTSGRLLLANLPLSERKWQILRASEHFQETGGSSKKVRICLPEEGTHDLEGANDHLPGVYDIACFLDCGSNFPPIALTSSCLLGPKEKARKDWVVALRKTANTIMVSY